MEAEKAERLRVPRSAMARKGLGADEMNLAEFPLAVFSRRLDDRRNTAEFEDDIFDEGAKQFVRRRLVISGSDRFGLPTPLDTDVLLVLIQLTKQRTNFETRILAFSRYEVIELLRWNHSGASYHRLEETLQRWSSTTLYYHGAWWDRAVRRWKSKTFHVIETLDLKRSDRGGAEESSCSLAWNEVLFQSFQASNLKALDLDTYFQLKRPAARQAYRFLDKRFYHSSRLEFDLRVFACEHVGLSRAHDSAQLKRALQAVFSELEEIGFLEPMSGSKRYIQRGRGKYLVVLLRNKHRASPTQGNSDNTLVSELTKRGVWADAAPALATALHEDETRRYLALHDWLLKRGDKRNAKNPAGFLASCIAKRLPFPKDFEHAQNRTKAATRAAGVSKPVPSSSSRAPEESSDSDSAALEIELARLTDTELSLLEADAVRGARPIVVAAYARLREKGGALFDGIRKAILVEHLKRQRLEHERGSPQCGPRDAG